MKLFVSVIFALLLSVVSAGEDKYMRMLKTWTKTKAMEGCFGKENSKMHMVKFKKAMNVCKSAPVPAHVMEMDFPAFDMPVRVANAFAKHAHKEEAGDMLDQVMKASFLKKLLKKQRGEIRDLLDDDDSDMPFFKRTKRDHHTGDDHEHDEAKHMLPDQFVERINGIRDQWATEIGNFTCMLEDMGLVDSEHNLDMAGIEKCMDEFDFEGRAWLKEKLMENYRGCYKYATTLPESTLTECSIPPQLTKIMHFKKCMKLSKLETCMNFDVIEKMEDHKMPVSDLAESMEVEEKDLLPVLAAMFNMKH